MKLKVCGMKYQDNISQVAALRPDYLGFIFHKPSPRHFTSKIPKINTEIKKVGVFVDYSLQEVIKLITEFNFVSIQLHGKESPDFCKQLKAHFKSNSNKKDPITITKVFSIRDEFDFGQLKPYEAFVDYFLFDTKGELVGGNGYTFDWGVLKDYPSTKPFFLSGGIGLETLENLKAFKENPVSQYCHAIDVNSKFEIEPGLKNIEELKEFKSQL